MSTINTTINVRFALGACLSATAIRVDVMVLNRVQTQCDEGAYIKGKVDFDPCSEHHEEFRMIKGGKGFISDLLKDAILENVVDYIKQIPDVTVLSDLSGKNFRFSLDIEYPAPGCMPLPWAKGKKGK